MDQIMRHLLSKHIPPETPPLVPTEMNNGLSLSQMLQPSVRTRFEGDVIALPIKRSDAPILLFKHGGEGGVEGISPHRPCLFPSSHTIMAGEGSNLRGAV